MLAKYFARQLDRLGIHYGWIMVALAFVTTVCSSAAFSLPGVLMVPMTAEFGWSRTDVSSAVALMFIVLASIAPFSGGLMLRYGLAPVVTMSVSLVAVGLFLTTVVSAQWHLLISIGCFLGMAAGMIGLGLASTVASRWFVARRGLVVGILTAAFAAGQLTFIPLAAWLSTSFGWRSAVLPPLIGGAACAILFLLFGRNWPSDVGLPPYGETAIQPPPPASGAGAMKLELCGKLGDAAIRRRAGLTSRAPRRRHGR